MVFYNNVKLVEEETPRGKVYKIVFLVADNKEESFIVKPDTMEHLLNQYRKFKQ
ncbi:hypothetical protein [Vibrio phage RYC]|nr:hypothetical protein [Vibrio phage RYC]